MTTLTTLTRHFVSGFVTPPILTELGHDFLRRTLSSLVAILLVIGIFLPRSFSKKYIDLGASLYREVYDRALHADIVLMIAVPMLIVGFIALVLCPLLFPDETDYRVLTPLPISRAQIFAAKLLALTIVVTVCVVAVNAIASIWFPMVTGGWRVRHSLAPRVAAHAVATIGASAWTFSAVIALQGLGLVLLPSRAQQRIGLLLQAGLFVALLVSIPFVARIPAMEVSSTSVLAAPLVWLPPVWFAGIEQWMLDGEAAGGYARVATFAAGAFGLTLLVVAITYYVLYRSAERLAGASTMASNRARHGRSLIARLADRLGLHPATTAVLDFIVSGLGRSRLHQFVFLLVVGVGLALLINQVLKIDETTEPITAAFRARTIEHAALGAPLIAALAMVLALRMVFLLPLDYTASWIFRLTEAVDMRRDALDAVARAFIVAATIPAVIVAVLVQPAVIGSRVIVSVMLTLILCLNLVEVVLGHWNRIPYTCSYLPGKRVMAYTLGVLVAAYAVFVYLGAHVIRGALTSPIGTLVVGLALVILYAALRRSRLRTWGVAALEFEDEDPLAPRSLGLLADER